MRKWIWYCMWRSTFITIHIVLQAKKVMPAVAIMTGTGHGHTAGSSSPRFGGAQENSDLGLGAGDISYHRGGKKQLKVFELWRKAWMILIWILVSMSTLCVCYTYCIFIILTMNKNLHCLLRQIVVDRPLWNISKGDGKNKTFASF